MACTPGSRIVVALLAIALAASSTALAAGPTDSGLESVPGAEGLSPADAAQPLPTEALRGEMASASMAPADAAPEAGGGEFFTLDELRAEMRGLTWTKGDFSITPYGWLWGSAIYETERTSPGQYTLYVLSATDQGDHSFVIDTRRTRLGLNVGGPGVPMLADSTTGGRVEIDFHGAFVAENKPGVLLRLAYGEIKNEHYRLLAGQAEDVISPLVPGVLNYSVGWAGGNIGYRRAQIRGERYFDVSDDLLLTAQASLNQNIISDLAGTAGVTPESTGWPVIEGRFGTTLGERGPGCLPITMGVSGHIGEQGFDFIAPGPAPHFLPPRDDARIPTWSLNGDLRVPLTERFGVQGEFFTGSNLSTFLGGIVQGVSPFTRRGIRSTGGWFDVWYDWTPRLHSHAGYGLDDPVNADIISGRCYNQFYFTNIVFDVTKNLNVGFEVSSWKTLYRETRPGFPDLAPGESVVFEFTGKYGF